MPWPEALSGSTCSAGAVRRQGGTSLVIGPAFSAPRPQPWELPCRLSTFTAECLHAAGRISVLLGAPAKGSEAAASIARSTSWPTQVLVCGVCTPAPPAPLPPSPPSCLYWGSQDRRGPLRVRPAFQPHSLRLGGPRRACSCVLIPSLKCVQTPTGLCVSPAPPHSIPVLRRPASLLPRWEIGPRRKQEASLEPALTVRLSGPTPSGGRRAGRCGVVVGGQRTCSLPRPLQSGCWGE